MRKPEPDERIAALVAAFFAPLPPSDFEYELILENVAREMEDA